MNDLRVKATVVGVAVIAGAIGAVLGLLLAPVSGREARRMLTRRFDEERGALLRKGQRAVDALSDQLEDQLDQGKRRLRRVVNR